MSGDVQPRKRNKDKKKKKDELGIEEPRGTAAALGEGDVFMHSYSDHGTGGHWCAKIIFFSLLAVLVTLIGLIILENRGLSELEANSVETRYSNILEGWLEDAPDDDHHDEHTLELKHHDNDEDDHYESHGAGDHENDDEHEDADEDDHADDDEDEISHEEDENTDEDDESADEDEDEDANNDEDEQTYEDDDEQNNKQDSQQNLYETDEDEDDVSPYKYYAHEDEDDDEDETNNDFEDNEQQDMAQDEDEDDQDNDNRSDEGYGSENDDEDELDEDEETNDNNDDDEEENLTREDEDDHDEHEKGDDDLEVEKIEHEASEEEPINVGLPVLSEEDDDEDHDKDDDQEGDNDDDDDDEAEADDKEDAADDDFLEADEPVVERITAPAGKPFIEVDEDDISNETPPDTLEEEEEYEKQQEELRKEEEQSTHHIWLKLTVGAALLVATQAVLRRATAPREDAEDENVEREGTPAVDRRMTLIPEDHPKPVVTKKEIQKPVFEEFVRREAPVVKNPVVQQESEEEEVEEPEIEEVVEEEIEEDEPEKLEVPKKKVDKELYSDEEEEEEEERVAPRKEAPKYAEPPKPEPEDEDPDDVEIIDDEQLEEEEIDDEDDVSDVDDAELLSRLEAKYGRLPEPERPGMRHKDGGNSINDDAWPGEPADAYWRQQLDSAERDLRQGAWSAALSLAGASELRESARARYVAAQALDRMAEAKRDNTLLSRAIEAYFRLLEMSDRLPDKKLLKVTQRTLDRIQFRGNYLKAEPVYRVLIRRFPNEPAYRNNMSISFLMANRNDLAENVLKETLARWPDDRVALANYGFILKTSHKDKLEEAVELFRKALEGDKGPACEPRFYYHYGDALLLLGRYAEAHEVHKRGAKLGHFFSPAQRSLYNVPRLKSRPWWNVEDTPYAALARNLERNWKEILKEGERAAALYKEEEEGLRERGQWTQMDLFARGKEVSGRCSSAPVTCGAVRSEPAAMCRRGQVKFSLMSAGTHVRPHVGPTNCRLRMHLGLSNTRGTFLRVDQETRQWQEGKVLLFDDSFEHEVWHNGSEPRLVLIVDVWHPDLTPLERRTLAPI